MAPMHRMWFPVLLSLALFPCSTGAAGNAILQSVSGRVRVKIPPAAALVNATPGLNLPEGSQVITLKEGKAEVRFDDGHFIRLAELTTVTLDKVPERNTKGTIQTLVHLLRGRVRAITFALVGEGEPLP